VRWFKNEHGNAEENKKALRALSVLRLMGLFDRPAPADCIAALMKTPTIPSLTDGLVGKSEVQRNIAYTQLASARLLMVNRDAAGALVSLDAHPLLREYFAKHLREQYPKAWRAAHRRLYKHLYAMTKEGEQPTLVDLQPLYQAVVHGCLAGMQQEACEKVYRDRIQRREEAYSAKKLGALGSDLGAVACFFERPWLRVSPAITEVTQAWLLNEAAYRLRALGRLREALEPMRAGLEMGVSQKSWKSIAARANNLSELELMLGELDAALGDAGQAVGYAEQIGDDFLRSALRTTHADALHQAGRVDEAEALFVDAEKMQAERQPDFPLLYSLGGGRYCDLLLAAPERAAWQYILNLGHWIRKTELLNICRAISKRTEQTLLWADSWQKDILSASLDHLTLGRVALYVGILESSAPDIARHEIESAMDGLRRAGMQNHLPRGLLSRAWLRMIENYFEGAQADLDEALEIAERGPMPLFMADIYLYRARLFFREATYPWSDENGAPRSAKQDLAEARRLIEKHGYWRRKEELEDAEAVIGR
jgi:tetratricopeptide (TPR) repeat protein